MLPIILLLHPLLLMLHYYPIPLMSLLPLHTLVPTTYNDHTMVHKTPLIYTHIILLPRQMYPPSIPTPHPPQENLLPIPTLPISTPILYPLLLSLPLFFEF